MVTRRETVSLRQLQEATERTADATEDLADQTSDLRSEQSSLISNTGRAILSFLSLSAVMGIVSGDELDAARQAGVLSSAWAESENASDRLAISVARLKGILGEPFQTPYATIKNEIADATDAVSDFLEENKAVSAVIGGGTGIFGLAGILTGLHAAFRFARSGIKEFLNTFRLTRSTSYAFRSALEAGVRALTDFRIGTARSNIVLRALDKTYGATIRSLGRVSKLLGIAGIGLSAWLLLTGATTKSQAQLNDELKESVSLWSKIGGPIGGANLALDALDNTAQRVLKTLFDLNKEVDNTNNLAPQIALGRELPNTISNNRLLFSANQQIARQPTATAQRTPAPYISDALTQFNRDNPMIGRELPNSIGNERLLGNMSIGNASQATQVLPGRELPNQVPNIFIELLVDGGIQTRRETDANVLRVVKSGYTNGSFRGTPQVNFGIQ